MQIVLVWAASRILVFACAAFVQLTGFPRASWRPGLLGHPFALLTIWDGRWYQIIAEHGYLLVPQNQSDPAFFPLLPILLRTLHGTGLSYGTGGLLIANASFLIGLLAFYELGRVYLSEADARRAALYATIAPLGFVFSMVYPESLAFAAVSLAGICAVRGRWLGALSFGAVAALTRPQGALIAIPLAAIAYSGWRSLSSRDRARAVAAVLAPVAALVAISLYFWSQLGDPLAWSVAEKAWGRSFALTSPPHAVLELATSPFHHKTWLVRDAAFCVVYIAAILVARRAGIPLGWVAMGLLVVLLPIASGSFTSDGRFGLLALPVYWGAAVLGRRPWVHRTLLVVCPVLLVAGVVTILLRFP
jgi:hypothetical protein